MNINNRNLTIVFYLLFVFVFCCFIGGCSSSSSSSSSGKPPHDLSTDSNDDGVPDDLEQAYEAAMKIVAGGETAGLDEDELSAFSDALKEMQERLPYSDETEQLLDELAELTAEMMLVEDATQFARLQEEIRQKLDLLEGDNTYRIVQQSLELLRQQAADAVQNSSASAIQSFSASSRAANAAALSAASAVELPNFGLLQKGDMMFARHAHLSTTNLLYVRDYGHAGIYNGNSFVYESGTELGVSFKPLGEWQEDGMTVALARIKSPVTQANVIEAMDWALSEYGYGDSKKTPYNWGIPDKYTDAGIYCSQLLWKVFDYLEVDVDSNDPKLMVDLVLQFGNNAPAIIADKIGAKIAAVLWLPLQVLGAELMPRFVQVSVLPDEVALSSFVSVYNVGRNKTIVAPTTLVTDYVIRPGITIPFKSSGASLDGGTAGIEYRFSLSWSDQKKIFWRPSESSFWTTNTWRGLSIPNAAAGGYIKIRVDVRDANNVLQNTDKAEFTFSVPAAS